MIVGLTGGIASGKSLVADYFRELGVPVIDTDEIARQVVAPGQPAWHCLREAFGSDYFLPDGQLDRAAMAQRVFADEEARITLESITHPAIFTEVDRQTAALQHASSPPVIVVVVPLLFEVSAEDRFDATIVVKATPQQQRERLQRTRGYSDEEADARLAAQLPLETKLARADYRIDNTGTIEQTRAQVRDLLGILLEKH
ncbi:MAG: dephospho-CoA kinase [Armatimonadota bacterium]